jgi:peptidyl-tRNA hydrolase, PTH1 family
MGFARCKTAFIYRQTPYIMFSFFKKFFFAEKTAENTDEHLSATQTSTTQPLSTQPLSTKPLSTKPLSTQAAEKMNTFLIVGLGNIGNEYALTRHNVGFLALDRLAAARNIAWTTGRLGDIAEFKIKNRSFILLKPSTYMNLSGKAVKYWMQTRKIEIENVFIVVDELALPFGSLRIKGSGSDGGHNGLKSINEVLDTQKYARLRVGIGNEFQKGKQVDYVLGTWSDEELAGLPAILDACGDAIRCFCMAGMSDAMNKFNKKVLLPKDDSTENT